MKTTQTKMYLLKKHYPLLKHMASCTADQCQHIMKGANNEVIRLMGQICINVMNKTLIQDPEEAIRVLGPYKKQLRAITRPHTPVKVKKSVLEQKGGFLSALLSIALPVLSSIISGITGRK